MNAEEARKLTEESLVSVVQREYEDTIKEIEKAIVRGEWTISVDKRAAIVPLLQEQGFTTSVNQYILSPLSRIWICWYPYENKEIEPEHPPVVKDRGFFGRLWDSIGRMGSNLR